MKKLAALIDKLEASSSDLIREQVDLALGLWSSAHDTAHKIVTISENSVAFVDDKGVLWASRYQITEDQKVIITGMKPVMNINEEENNTDFLDEICESVVELVMEDRCADADAMIANVMEAKYRAVRAGRLKRINDPIIRKRNWRKRDVGARWNIIKGARRTSKRTALRPMKKMRYARSMKRRKAMGLKGLAGRGPQKVAGYDVGNVKESINESIGEGKNGYIGFFGDKEVEIYADTLADAKQKAMDHFKPKKADRGQVSVHLAEKDGKQVTSVSETVWEALEDMPSVAVNLMTAITADRKRPVLEGHILERDEQGNPLSYIPKGTTRVVPICERYYTTGEDIDIPADTIKEKGEDDKFIPAGHYDIKNMNPRTTTLCVKGEDGNCKHFKCSTVAVRKMKKNAAKAAKTEEKVVEEGQEPKRVLNVEPAVIINLKSLNEAAIPDDDFFIKMATAWEQFRGQPVNEENVAVLKTVTEDTISESAQKIADDNSFLTICTEAEIYEAIEPHCEAFDPTVIKDLAKQIHEHSKTEESQKEIADFLDRFSDKALVEELTDGMLPISECLDCLFLEGDQFDFGSADELGSDDLEDDLETDEMEDDLDQDLDQDGDKLDTFDDGLEERTIQVTLNVDDLRDDMNTILDVIGDEIEDNEEFDELRAKFEDEEEEVEEEDVVRLLQVVGDYFSAVAADRDSRAEEDAESEMGDETMDDMDDMGSDDPSLDPEGVGGDDPGGAGDDLDLGV